MGTNIYQALYDLINTYVFGGSLVVGTYPELITVILSTIGVCYLVLLPFIVVHNFLKYIGGR